MRQARIAHRIALVGGMPVLVAAAIAIVAWFLLQQADRAHQSAVVAGTIYRELLEASAARSDYLHATPERRDQYAERFDSHTAQASAHLDMLMTSAADVALAQAVSETTQTLDGYAERMTQFKAVTRQNDALIAVMNAQAAKLIDITDSARQRQRIANIRFSETVADSDRRLRLHRDVLDSARALRGTLAGIWRQEAGRLSGAQNETATAETSMLVTRLQLAAKTLDEALFHAVAGGQVERMDSFVPAAGGLGEALHGSGNLQDIARALEGRIDQILNVHGTAFAAVQDEVTELTGHAVEANETEQEVQNIAVAVLKLTRRTADAVVQRDIAATDTIIRDSAALETHMARVPIPPLVQDDMISAMDNWRGSLAKARTGLGQQEAMIASMDADAETMSAGARALNDIFRSHADRIGAFLRSILVFGATAGLLLAASAAFFVARSIAQPLNRLQRQMVLLADDPLSGNISDTHRSDELGAMARAVQLFVTEISQREVALHQAKDQAEEATRAKSSFLAVMSHEIRTPMNGVTAMAEMLDQTDMTDEQHGMIGIIRSSAQALLTIINDILDFSKIEAGKLELESIPLSPAEVAEEAAELVTGRAEEKALSLVVDVAPDVPEQVLGDPTRVRQVLINLVGNAIKFTQFGDIQVRVFCQPGQGATPAMLRYEVQDSGIGLTPEQRSRLFQPFQQADSTTSRKYGGTGLGLTICHRLCMMMGGAIGVESVYGEGATFWFTVPLQPVADMQQAPTPADIHDAQVLAVGFDGASRAALANLLRAANIRNVQWAEFRGSLFAVVSQAVADSPQRLSIILNGQTSPDIAMACGRQIIEAGLTPAPGVMLAASRALVSTLGEADRIGLFCTLTLPLRRRRVWQAIAAVLGRADLERRGMGYDRDATGYQPPDLEQAATARAVVLVAEDNPINQTVIRRMLTQRGYALEMADNGVEALALYQPDRHGLVLTDFHMPEMDGFGLTRAIRSAEEKTGEHVPIVALTADALPGTEQRCIEAGMDGYLTKPIESRLLVEALNRYLPQARALRRPVGSLPAANIAPTANGWSQASIDPDIFDTNQLLENFAANDPEAMVFLGSFLSIAPKFIAATTAGLDAQDYTGARDAVHALKGAALSIGAARLGRLAADIQDLLDADDTDTAGLMAGLLDPTLAELIDATAEIRAVA